MHTSHGWSPVRAGLGSVQKRLKISPQILLVVRGRLSVHARCPILACALVSFVQQRQVEEVVQRCEPHLRRLPGQLCYPLSLREHSSGVRCLRHVSLQRFDDSTPPSLHRVPPRWVPLLQRYCEDAPTPAHPSHRTCLGRPAVPHAASSVSLPSTLDAQPGAWKFRVRHSRADFAVEMNRSPRFLGNPCVRSPGSSTPAGPNLLAVAGDSTRPQPFGRQGPAI
jgi:hypothetical protein